MSLLQIYRNKELYYELELESSREYKAGRSSQSDIMLEGSPEISRFHLRIFFEDNSWWVEVLSRFGELYQNSEKVEKIRLQMGDQFSVPPFDFTFAEAKAIESAVVPVTDESRGLEISSSQSADPDQGSSRSLTSSQSSSGYSSSMVEPQERTEILRQSIFPFLTITAEDRKPVTYKLDGHHWTLGRDPSATVVYENQKLSRKHIELKLEEQKYFVQDLGSSNGTTLNGDALEPYRWHEIQSGDRLSVVDIVMEFEVRDASFEDRWSQVPANLRDDRSLFESPNPIAGDLSFGAQDQIHSQQSSGAPNKKKINWVRIAIGLILIGGAGLYLMDDPKAPTPTTSAGGKPSESAAFEKLPNDKKQYIKDTYRMADRLFKEGRYELARQEVAKIHQLVPKFEESQQIEKYAVIAIQTQIEQKKAEEAEKEKAEVELKIRKTVMECRKKVSSKVEMRTIDDCLSPVMALNPDHPEIHELKNQVEGIIAQRTARKIQQEEYAHLVKKRQDLYEKAVQLHKEDKSLEAIEAYQAVVQSKLPDPANLAQASKREISSIQQNLQKKSGELEKTADDQLKAGNLKVAISSLQAAVKVNPENEVIRGRLNSLISELKKQMQNLYQEAVLEESVGEIESAKTKWKKILELSIPEEDYYKKSKIKLKKYEAS